MHVFVPCSTGLEYLLVDELVELGAERATAALGGVNAIGDEALPYRLLMHSRLASRALWPLTVFDCPDVDALYREVAAIDWLAHLGEADTLAVDANVSGPGITHARFAAQRVKDAIVDQFRAAAGVRPSVDPQDPDLRLNLSVRKGHASLSVDLGGPLHRRGWRREQGLAPLRETLAAAVLLRGGWPMLDPGAGLLDPMCGSGTLVIEGAMMSARVAPGLSRGTAAARWRGFDTALWERLGTEAARDAAQGLAALAPCFFGRDVDPGMIGIARRNAAAAGVADAIRFEAGGIDTLTPPGPSHGLVVCNPPHDTRLAADRGLYRALGDALRRAVPGWRLALLAGSRELAMATGLRADKVHPLRNAALDCVLLLSPRIDRGRGSTAPRPLTDGARMVVNRLRRNLRGLRAWRRREQVDCFRAYDADLPEYAAAVDIYTEAEGAQRVFAHVQEYRAPAEVPEADARRRFNELQRAVGEVFGLPDEQIATKTRARGRGGSRYGRLDQRDDFIIVREGAARLRVNLFDRLDTGLFLDHRPLRLRIGTEAAGRRFLNLFAYTGAASVHAALGGASATTSVDLSAPYLEWAAANLALNGCSGRRHRLVQADALRWLEADRGEYDLIFCDSPTFSNSARAEDFDIQREHVRLLRAAVARLAEGGLLLFSNNYRRFRFDADAVSSFASVEDIGPESIPPDFQRNPRIHRAWALRRRVAGAG